MATRREALEYPRGDIALAFCRGCGFIFNGAFDPRLQEYSTRYEETQAFSPTFNAFHQALASRLIRQYSLRSKTVLEIGCGKGEFLALLCELGNNRGIGFDPSYVSSRNQSRAKDRMTLVQDFYSDKYAEYQADFVCCKMTLEHIPQTGEFVQTVRRAIGDSWGTVVFFQVPDVTRILREAAFWDIYYEHCSYFSPGSLGRLFRQYRFEILDIRREYNGQYLTVEARPSGKSLPRRHPLEEEARDLAQDVVNFEASVHEQISTWTRQLRDLKDRGSRAVLWCGGSKGVSFLSTLDIREEIQYAVDINPHKHGTYMAGTGQMIVGPAFLQEYKPDLVILMNPVYRPEVEAELRRMKLSPEVLTV